LEYIRENDRAVRKTPYRLLVLLTLISRMPQAIKNELDKLSLLKRFITFVLPPQGIVRNRLKRLFAVCKNIFHGRKWKRIFSYEYDPKKVDVRWNIVHTDGRITVPIDLLLANLVTTQGNKLFSLEETPHYLWIKSLVIGEDNESARLAYCDYISTYYPESDVKMEMENAHNLIDKFSASEFREKLITIVTYPPKMADHSDYSIVIYDGLHRSAIAKVLGHKEIRCRVVVG